MDIQEVKRQLENYSFSATTIVDSKVVKTRHPEGAGTIERLLTAGVDPKTQVESNPL